MILTIRSLLKFIKPKCKTCGKTLKFNHGFTTFCSHKCSNADPEVLKKNRINVSKALAEAYKERGDEIKEKRMHTLQERYDIDVSTSSPFGIKAIMDKISDK